MHSICFAFGPRSLRESQFQVGTTSSPWKKEGDSRCRLPGGRRHSSRIGTRELASSALKQVGAGRRDRASLAVLMVGWGTGATQSECRRGCSACRQALLRRSGDGPPQIVS
jgi:hypothetical protein